MVVRAGLLTVELLSVAGFAATGVRTAHAQERPAQERHVSVSLVAETRGMVPGRARPFKILPRGIARPVLR